jgi:hypothetical protein
MEDTYAQALATIRDANTPFVDYAQALRLVAACLGEEYVSQIDVTGKKVLVVSSVCDFSTMALPVGDALGSYGAHVIQACLWIDHHPSPLGGFCGVSKSFYELRADEDTHVIIVSSVAENSRELEGLTIAALEGDKGEIRPASLSVIAAVVGAEVFEDYSSADLFDNEPPIKQGWLCGETSTDLTCSALVTPAMRRMGLTSTKNVDFPPYVKAKLQEMIDGTPSWIKEVIKPRDGFTSDAEDILYDIQEMDRQKRANFGQAELNFVEALDAPPSNEDLAIATPGQVASGAAELTEMREKSAFVARQLLRALERMEPKDGVILKAMKDDKTLAFASVGELREMVAYIFAQADPQ